MKIKIVTDSASNMLSLEGVEFHSAPLVIRTDEKDFVDDASLDVEAMADYLKTYKGKSGTACPGVGDYLAAFVGYDLIVKADVEITQVAPRPFNSEIIVLFFLFFYFS